MRAHPDYVRSYSLSAHDVDLRPCSRQARQILACRNDGSTFASGKLFGTFRNFESVAGVAMGNVGKRGKHTDG